MYLFENTQVEISHGNKYLNLLFLTYMLKQDSAEILGYVQKVLISVISTLNVISINWLLYNMLSVIMFMLEAILEDRCWNACYFSIEVNDVGLDFFS